MGRVRSDSLTRQCCHPERSVRPRRRTNTQSKDPFQLLIPPASQGILTTLRDARGEFSTASRASPGGRDPSTPEVVRIREPLLRMTVEVEANGIRGCGSLSSPLPFGRFALSADSTFFGATTGLKNGQGKTLPSFTRLDSRWRLSPQRSTRTPTFNITALGRESRRRACRIFAPIRSHLFPQADREML